NVVINIEGFDFSDSIEVSLRNEADTSVAVHSFSIESVRASAHLNLDQLSPGVYDVVLQRKDRGDEAILESAFFVEDSAYQDLFSQVVAPEEARINREADIQVNFGNRGNVNEYDVFLYVSFFRTGFKTDSIEIEYIGDGISDRLPPEASIYESTDDDIFIKDENAWHFIGYSPIMPAQNRGQLSFKIKGAVEDTIFIRTFIFRNKISRIHFSGNLDDLTYTTTMMELDRILSGEPEGEISDSDSKKATKSECQQDPKVVEAMLVQGIRNHAENVLSGAPNPKLIFGQVLEASMRAYVDPSDQASPEGVVNDLTDDPKDITLDPTEKNPYKNVLNNLDACLTPDIVKNVNDR
ncbi:MAG: hypothetical protein ACP5E3_20310, partial [Bacteroidales bacterium]